MALPTPRNYLVERRLPMNFSRWLAFGVVLFAQAFSPLSGQSPKPREGGSSSAGTQTATPSVEGEQGKRTYKAAIFVSNRAGRDYDAKIPVLEDLVSSQVADLGFVVLTREATINSLKAFDPAVASLPQPADGLDAQFTNQTSALRLAQNLGVDYILQVSLLGFSNKLNKTKAYGVETETLEKTLRITYKVLDASAGGSLTGDTVRVETSAQQTANATIERDGVADELLDAAAQKVMTGLRQRIALNRIAPPAAKAAFVTVNVRLEAADMMIPDVRIGEENTVSIGESKYKLAPLNATVEVDGVAIGSAPGTVSIRPGLAKLRITREGFKPWEKTINAVEGQTLSIALSLSEAGYARWQDATVFINALKNGAKLTDAQVKVLEGHGKMLSESFSRMDTKENVKFLIPGLRW